MEHWTDRVTLWVLRSAATALLFAGGSIVIAAVPMSGMAIESRVVRAIAGALLQVSAVFIATGAAGRYLSRLRRALLPNERVSISEANRPGVGGWLIALAVALVALPAWLFLRLQPFLAEWRYVIDLLAASRIWESANANMSGIVLVPLAVGLAPPSLELVAALGFPIASAALIALLLSRSRRFPRVYLASVVLLSGFVAASALSARAARRAEAAVPELLAQSNPRPEEAAQVRDALARYTAAVQPAANALVWVLCGYLVWIPAVVWSKRARTTFAASASDGSPGPAGAMDVEAITRPPRFPG